MIRVALPYHLRTLCGAGAEVALTVRDPVTISAVIEVIEKRYPMLKGTIRDPATGRRRPYLRFFAGERDLSHISMDALLPGYVIDGSEPLIILGAVAGG